MQKLLLALVLLPAAVGCGTSGPSPTRPLTDDDRRQIEEMDKKVGDDERAVGPK